MHYFSCNGDCGIFVIKHFKHLIENKSLTDVVDMHMRFWREKLCIDLFSNNLDP